MATKKKMLQAAAGVGGAGLDITDVFSTYLYKANSTARSITNGIDLAGEGGLVWLKSRSSTREHALYDTERGVEKLLKSNSTGVQQNTSGGLTAFNSDGFSLGTYADVNGTSYGDFASWTFRKAPKFFDVQTWTGSGVAGRTVSHNLGSVPGMIIVKRTDSASDWTVYHRGAAADPETDALFLNTTAAANDHPSYWNDTAPTDTVFSVGNGSEVNSSSGTYVAYLFAHNDGDGEFGPSGDQDIIKCGSFEGPSATVSLGFEPQWLLLKNVDQTNSDWAIYDVMRGISYGWHAKELYPNKSNSESVGGLLNNINLNADGFRVEGGYSSTYIYMAIRRGPLNPPTAGTEVFAVGDGSAGASGNAGRYRSGFSVDMGLEKDITGSDNWELVTRLLSGTSLRPNGTNAEDTGVGGAKFDYMDGWNTGTAWADSYSWMWKRAPSFFDVVAYTGSGVAGRTVSHNLGVVPEMMWVKRRNSTGHWYVYHTGMTGGSDALHSTARLNLNEAGFNTQSWKNYDFTTAHFSLDNAADINGSGGTYIAYLFATLDGISKVGSVSHSGSSTDVNCGFSNGARFVMLKRTDATGDWYIWDSVRGIVSGNDPYLLLNSQAAEVTNTDYIDPLSSGFTISDAFTDGDYIFYAIA